MTGLEKLVNNGASMGAVRRFLEKKFQVESDYHRPSVPFFWEFRCCDLEGRCRLRVLVGQSRRTEEWFYDVLPGEDHVLRD